ncbi:hypothetical protein [Aquipuribacter sp. SD81]|uniref:hypothetical protein n=1 Tax=Aquipuribacter sp. SD81 TaxID=3127703 RepID=UPI00301B41E5
MNEPGATDQLLDRLAAADPARRLPTTDSRTLRGLAAAAADDSARGSSRRTGTLPLPTVVPAAARRPSTGVGALLVAAVVLVLAVGSAVVVTGRPSALAEVSGRVSEWTESQPDREAEAARYEEWLSGVRGCFDEQYPDAVTVDASGLHVAADRLPAGERRQWDTRTCVLAAGEAPRRAPLSDRELRAHHAALRSTATCLAANRLAAASSDPGLAGLTTAWRDPRPASPPWTPYADVAPTDLVRASQSCPLPSPPAPPAWAEVQYGTWWGLDATGLYGEEADLGAGDRTTTHAVAFTRGSAEAQVACMTANGVPAVLQDDGGWLLEDEVVGSADRATRATAVDLCLLRHPRPTRFDWDDREDVAALYAWFTDVQAPCLRAHGVEPDPAPGLEDFVRDPYAYRPYGETEATTLGDHDSWVGLTTACAQEPPLEELATG